MGFIEDDEVEETWAELGIAEREVGLKNTFAALSVVPTRQTNTVNAFAPFSLDES